MPAKEQQPTPEMKKIMEHGGTWIHYAYSSHASDLPDAKEALSNFLALAAEQGVWSVSEMPYPDVYHAMKAVGCRRLTPMKDCGETAWLVEIPEANYPIAIYTDEPEGYAFSIQFISCCRRDEFDYGNGLSAIIRAYCSLHGPQRKFIDDSVGSLEDEGKRRANNAYHLDPRCVRIVKLMERGEMELSYELIAKLSARFQIESALFSDNLVRTSATTGMAFDELQKMTLGKASSFFGLNPLDEFWGQDLDGLLNILYICRGLPSFWSRAKKSRAYRSISAKKRRETGSGKMEWSDILEFAERDGVDFCIDAYLSGVPADDIFA